METKFVGGKSQVRGGETSGQTMRHGTNGKPQHVGERQLLSEIYFFPKLVLRGRWATLIMFYFLFAFILLFHLFTYLHTTTRSRLKQAGRQAVKGTTEQKVPSITVFRVNYNGRVSGGGWTYGKV